MQQRRVFLSVLSGSVGAAVVGGGCGGSNGSGVGGLGGAGGGAGGDGSGTGGMTSSDTSTVSSTSSSTAASSTASSASSSSGGNCTANPSGTNAGPMSMYMTPGLHQVNSSALFLVGYDAKGFYAMSSLCTHEFCNLNKSSKGSIIKQGVHCKCHGSEFDVDGNVMQGPAGLPLDNFKVEIGCDNNVYVEVNAIVLMGTRVVP